MGLDGLRGTNLKVQVRPHSLAPCHLPQCVSTESCFYRYKNRQTAALLRHQLICSCCPHRFSRSVLLKLAFWHKCFSVLLYLRFSLQVQAWPGCLSIQFQLSPPRACLLLPENRIRLLAGVAPKDTTKQRLGEGRIYYLLQIRRTLGIFPKAVFSWTAKFGNF